MLRRTVRVIFFLALAGIALWGFLRLVAEPLVRDISLCKREARELESRRERLELARTTVPPLTPAEKRRLARSRSRLRKRLTLSAPPAPAWQNLAAVLRNRARARGLKVLSLQETPRIPGQSHPGGRLPLKGTAMQRIAGRFQGPPAAWEDFLADVSRLPVYLTVSALHARYSSPARMYVEWIRHTIAAGAPLPVVTEDLVDRESPQLDRRLPPAVAGRGKER